MNRGPRPGGPGAGRPGGLGTGLGVGSPEGMPGGPGGPGQRARRGAPRPGGKAKRKRRMSKKALLELQGEALLQRERHRLDEDLAAASIRSQTHLKVGDSIRVGELAHEMSVKAAEVVRALFMNGMMVTLTQSIDFDTASLIAEEFGYQVEPSEATDDELLVTHVDSSEELLLDRRSLRSWGRRPRQDLVARQDSRGERSRARLAVSPSTSAPIRLSALRARLRSSILRVTQPSRRCELVALR